MGLGAVMAVGLVVLVVGVRARVAVVAVAPRRIAGFPDTSVGLRVSGGVQGTRQIWSCARVGPGAVNTLVRVAAMRA